MITAGIDVGIENLKAVILKDGKVIARGAGLSGGANRAKNAEKVWNDMLAAAKLTTGDIVKIVATGQGKNDFPLAQDRITEPLADARAARFLYPKATSVVDIGADQTRVVMLGPENNIKEVVMNQKCAAGLGILIKSMARTLGMTLEEISTVSGKSAAPTVNDGCSVFAEMDAFNLLNRNTPRDEIARAVIEAVSVRVNSILNDKVKPEKDATVLIGGVSRNKALVSTLKKRSGINFLIPEQAEYAGALGAALIAAG
ncbi:MAG: acyl-CoA dehydratase activase [Dehalococcoidales bacterium]